MPEPKHCKNVYIAGVYGQVKSVSHKLRFMVKSRSLNVSCFSLQNFPIAVWRDEVQFRDMWLKGTGDLYSIIVAARTMKHVTCKEGPACPEAYFF